MPAKKKVTVIDELEAIRLILDEQNRVFKNHLESETIWQADIKNKVDRIMDIRANGTVGFENIIHEMYMVTTGARKLFRFKQMFAAWVGRHQTFKSVVLWVTKKVAIVAFSIGLYLIAKYMGFEEEVLKIVKSIVGGG